MNIIVTGAGKGIGFEIVKLLAEDKQNKVIAISRNITALETYRKENDADNIQVFSLDVTNFQPSEIEKIAGGLSEIDILINNAGLLKNERFESMNIADWKAIFETNVFAVVSMCKAILPHLKKSNQPHILNIGSMGGVQGTSKFAGLSAYSASKAAIANVTECLAEELKDDNVKVNCLALGAVNTEMLQTAFPDYEAPVSSKEMAQYICWFALHAHRFMNGKIVPVSVTTP